MDHKLVFVQGSRAFFSHHDLDEVWGDDWNDAPYEHNAGWPYEEYVSAVVMFDSVLVTPDYMTMNSRFSVEDILGRLVPWLQRSRCDREPNVQIWAGTPLREFVQTIEGIGGTVYLPRTISWVDVDEGVA